MGAAHRGWTHWWARHVGLQVKHSIESLQVEAVHQGWTCQVVSGAYVSTDHRHAAFHLVAVPGMSPDLSSCMAEKTSLAWEEQQHNPLDGCNPFAC